MSEDVKLTERPTDTSTELAKDYAAYPRRRGLPLYFSLLAIQTIGILILLANIIPVYRLMALDFASYVPDPRPWWALIGILLCQVAYWLQVRLGTPLPQRRNIVLGHILLFVSRLTFVIVTATFATVFLTRFPDMKNLDYPPVRAVFLLVMFFAIFCWTLEIEKLAKTLLKPDERAKS